MDLNNRDILKISRGLIAYTRRLITQISIVQGFSEMLHEYKSIFDISTITGVKNLKLLRDYILSLSALQIIEQKGDTFKWVGGEIRITDEEKNIENLSLSWAVLMQWYSKRFFNTLKEENPFRFKESAVWDSLYSSQLYQIIWRTAIDKLLLDPNSVVLDIGCKTGWGTLNLLSNNDVKKVIAIDSDKKFIDIAEENITNFIPEKKDLVNFICHDFTKEFNISEYYDETLPNKILISYIFHWYDKNQHLKILNNIRKVISDDAQIIFIQPHIAHRNQSKFFELLFFGEAGFKGFPLMEDFLKVMSSAGFAIPNREFNLLLHTNAELPFNKELSISDDEPKFCTQCGKPLQKNTFYCAYCRSIIESSINFPLI